MNSLITLSFYGTSPSGHELHYYTSLEAACTASAISFSVYAPANSPPLAPFCIPFFRSSSSLIIQFFQRVLDLRNLFSQNISSSILIESYTTPDMLAIFLAYLFVKKRPRLFLLVRFFPSQKAPWTKKILGSIRHTIYRLLSSSVTFFTDSNLIRNALLPYCKAHLLPIPHTFSHSNEIKNSDSYVLWLPGKPRKNKGSVIIEKIARTPTQSKTISLWVEETLKIDQPTIPITYVKKGLSQDEYIGCFSKIDALLLPYDPIEYEYPTSGIFVEGICSGKCVFTSKNTWMAHELCRFGLEECILSWEGDPLLRISEIIISPATQQKLRIMQKEYGNYHSLTHFSSIFIPLIQNNTISC